MYILGERNKILPRPTFYKDEHGNTIIEIPLKDEMRTMSIRIPDETLIKIDKFIIMTQNKTQMRITRSELMREIIDALAELFASMNYDINKIIITCKNNNESRTIVLKISE